MSIIYIIGVFLVWYIVYVWYVSCFFNRKYQDTSECFELYVICFYRCEHTQHMIDELRYCLKYIYPCIQFWGCDWQSSRAFSWLSMEGRLDHNVLLKGLSDYFLFSDPWKNSIHESKYSLDFFWCKESASIEGLLILKHTTDRPCSSSQISGGEML